MNAKRKETEYRYKIAMLYRNREVSRDSRSQYQIETVDFQSEAVEIYSDSELKNWHGYIHLRWHLMTIKPTFFDNVLLSLSLKSKEYFLFINAGLIMLRETHSNKVFGLSNFSVQFALTDYLITEINFMQLNEILAKTGGLFALLKTFAFILVLFIMR